MLSHCQLIKQEIILLDKSKRISSFTNVFEDIFAK